MEALWTFPLYIVCPLAGLTLLFVGAVKIKNGRSKNTFYIGSLLLALPFIHLLVLSVFNLGLANDLTGKYSLGDEKEILTIKEDGTFELKNSILYLNSGHGKWEIEQIDFPILKLNFDSKNKESLWLEINESESSISLCTMSSGNDITTDFIKH